MNRKLTITIISLLLGVISFQAGAQENLKIGYVNVTKIFSASPQKAKGDEKIKKEFTLRMEKAKELEAAVRALQEKYNREAITMSERDLIELQDKMIAADRKFRQEQAYMQEDLKLRKQQALAEAQKEIGKAIQEIAQDGKYDLILTEGVFFTSQRLDISDEVLELLRKDN